MRNYTQEELCVIYAEIAKILQHQNIVKVVIEKGMPTFMVPNVLTDQLGLVCLAEGKYRNAGDFYLKMAIEQLEKIRKDYNNRMPPYDAFHDSIDN